MFNYVKRHLYFCVDYLDLKLQVNYFYLQKQSSRGVLSTFTLWYFSEKVCNVALSSYGLSFVWFYTNESFRDEKKKMVWLPIVF